MSRETELAASLAIVRMAHERLCVDLHEAMGDYADPGEYYPDGVRRLVADFEAVIDEQATLRAELHEARARLAVEVAHGHELTQEIHRVEERTLQLTDDTGESWADNCRRARDRLHEAMAYLSAIREAAHASPDEPLAEVVAECLKTRDALLADRRTMQAMLDADAKRETALRTELDEVRGELTARDAVGVGLNEAVLAELGEARAMVKASGVALALLRDIDVDLRAARELIQKRDAGRLRAAAALILAIRHDAYQLPARSIQAMCEAWLAETKFQNEGKP